MTDTDASRDWVLLDEWQLTLYVPADCSAALVHEARRRTERELRSLVRASDLSRVTSENAMRLVVTPDLPRGD